MKPDFRIYGTIRGLSPEDFKAIEADLPFETIDYTDGVLDLEHESSWLDIDDMLDTIKHVFGSEARGGIDLIDNQEWELTRYTIKPGGYESRKLPLNNVLEGM
ncbi:MAG: hypothetical protein ACNI3A_18875 [Desulfovibrio sp.]|uniref:hypothetical protein n=1 Tax=Desulfovibrio sp. 7SRBS1 TaxID=3378064 RepID=UPI003B41B608